MKRTPFLAILLTLYYSGSSQSWQRIQLLPDTTAGQDMSDGKLFGDTCVIMGGYGNLYYSTDYMNTYTVDTTYYANLLDVMKFVNRDTGYIPADHLHGGFLRTTNGGQSWQPLSYGPQNAKWGDLIAFTGNNILYSASTDVEGAVYRIDMTTLAQYFITPYLNVCNTIDQIWATNDSTVYILCGVGPNIEASLSLSVIRSVDSGSTWQYRGFTGVYSTGDFWLLDDTTIVVVATQMITKSVNAGDSFQLVMHSTDPNDGFNGYRHSIYFVGHDTGFVAFGGTVYRTYDAGDTWTKTDFAFDSTDIGNYIEFITASSSQKIIVGCANGNIYKTENGGGIYTGITQIKPPGAFTFYPNPTTGVLNIKPPGTITVYNVEITNLLGQTLYKGYPSNNTIDVSGLAAGIYLLKLEVNGVWQAAKFVKE